MTGNYKHLVETQEYYKRRERKNGELVDCLCVLWMVGIIVAACLAAWQYALKECYRSEPEITVVCTAAIAGFVVVIDVMRK